MWKPRRYGSRRFVQDVMRTRSNQRARTERYYTGIQDDLTYGRKTCRSCAHNGVDCPRTSKGGSHETCYTPANIAKQNDTGAAKTNGDMPMGCGIAVVVGIALLILALANC